MNSLNFGKRFGSIAITKGFITKDQFVEAMGVQIENELEGVKPKAIGTILLSMEYMTRDQIEEVLKEISDV
jgi:hypothetical protein